MFLWEDIRLIARQCQQPLQQRPASIEKRPDEDTAIIITSSSVPSHPSTYLIKTVLNSTKHLKGLSPTAPIFVAIDRFRFQEFAYLPKSLEEKIDALDEYTEKLFKQHLSNPRIHIIPAIKHLHVGGFVMRAMDLIEKYYPTVRYLCYMQHDYPFFKDVDHLALISAMDGHPPLLNTTQL